MDNQTPQTTNSHVQESHSGPGQPEVIDAGIEQLLIGAFQNGFNVTKACEYAGIARRTYYYKCQREPEFLRKMTVAQNNLLVLAGNRVSQILQSGDEKVAGPLAWKVFQAKMPDEYGTKGAVPTGPTQNNYFNLSNEQLGNITKQSGLDESDPVKLLEAVEGASNMDIRAEESSTS